MNAYYDTKTIHWIDWIKILEYSFILLASKRRSGKSVLCKNLLKKICNDFNIDFIIIFSKTASLNNDYWFVEKQYIYDYNETAEQKIKKIIDYQKKCIKSKKLKTGIIVFDDITLYRDNKEISNLAWIGRHLKLFIIMWCQNCTRVVNPIIRNN